MTRKFPCMFTKITDGNIEEDINNASLFVPCAGELSAQKRVPRNIRKFSVPGTMRCRPTAVGVVDMIKT